MTSRYVGLDIKFTSNIFMVLIRIKFSITGIRINNSVCLHEISLQCSPLDNSEQHDHDMMVHFSPLNTGFY